MSSFILHIQKNDYSNFKLLSENNDIIEINNNPNLAKGFFHKDIIKYNVNNDDPLSNSFELIERNLPKYIVGLLDLHSNYMYKSGNKNVFMFHPLSSNFPKCYVSCSMKHKYNTNVLCSVSLVQWNKDSKFPIANLNHIIGPINDFDTISMSILNNEYIGKIPKINKKDIDIAYPNILAELREKRQLIQYPIYSIDPDGCRDIDDAFSFYEEPNLNNIIIQIHISDVYTLLTKMGFLENIESTTSIYLPHKQIPMLPSIISSGYGSLLEGNERLMVSLQIRYSCELEDATFKVFPSYGYITKNYTYDNYPKKFEKYYSLVEKIYYILTKKIYRITDSHKFIECMMLIYNYYFGNSVLDNCLYRVQKSSKDHISELTNLNENNIIDDSLSRFLSIINSNSANYSLTDTYHTSLDMKQYIHITSPLRRIADIINQEIMYTGKSNILKSFTVEKINDTNKLIKKIVRNINKLYLAFKVYNDGHYNTFCYIFKVNLDKKSMNLYFPQENITIQTDIVPFKLKELTKINICEQCLIIENDMNKKSIPLLKQINVNIYGKPDIFDIDNSILIDFIN